MCLYWEHGRRFERWKKGLECCCQVADKKTIEDFGDRCGDWDPDYEGYFACLLPEGLVTTKGGDPLRLYMHHPHPAPPQLHQ